MQCQLDHAVLQRPRKRLTDEKIPFNYQGDATVFLREPQCPLWLTPLIGPD